VFSLDHSKTSRPKPKALNPLCFIVVLLQARRDVVLRKMKRKEKKKKKKGKKGKKGQRATLGY